MSEFQLIFYGLVAMNIAIYASLVLGFLRPKLYRTPKISDVAVAFGVLEDALSKSFPDLPAGFTWTEGLARAKNQKLKIDWNGVESVLRKYEAYRYGKDSTVSGDTREVLKLAYSLPRKPKYDRRSKR